MHRPLVALLGGLLLAGACRADPAEELEAAIRALLAQPNFSWRADFERTDKGRRTAYDGKTQRGGATIVTTARRNLTDWENIVDDTDRPTVIVFLGDRAVAKPADEWLTPRRLAFFLQGRSPVAFDALSALPSALRGMPGAKTAVWDDSGSIHLPRPDLILAILLGELENAKASGRAIVADVTERATLKLFDSQLVVPAVDPGRIAAGVRVGSPRAPDVPLTPPRPHVQMIQFVNGSGAGTFWIVDGALAKFELRLEADQVGRGAVHERHQVVLVVTLEEAGTTPVEVPEGARALLQQ